MGVDNAYVELDNLELPILDGSGLPFVELLRVAGVRETRRLRRYMRIIKPVSVAADGKTVSILPSDRFRLQCRNFFNHPLVGGQKLELEITPEVYTQNIAPARTYRAEYEVEQMRHLVLIRGRSTHHAVFS